MTDERLEIDGPAGALDALHTPTDGDRIALVLHPHPLHGGDMFNPVVAHAAAALVRSGFETLRINFRGVGRSHGSHDEGRGEVDDAAAGLRFLRNRHPDASRVIVAGYSFGSVVGLRLLLSDPAVSGAIAIAAPAPLLPHDVPGDHDRPILWIHGTDDQFTPLEAIFELAEGGSDAAETVRAIDGADHFFTTSGSEIESTVESWPALGQD